MTRVVILAGGKGSRLAPYTTVLPKPLMPIGDMPILEIIIQQLRYYGFTDITITVGHLASIIMAYFNDPRKYGVKLSYSREPGQPLGTAGPLALVSGLDSTFLVMNGDILTTVDYSRLVKHHHEQEAIATIALHERDVNIDFGVIEVNQSNEITNYIEKPNYHFHVSMGIYVLEPKILRYIEPGKHLDMPELIMRLLQNKERVIGYPYSGYWLDIGRREDHEKAIEDFKKMRKELLKETG